MAAAAAPFTSSGTYLKVVPDCQPARTYCTPCAVASWPLSGTGGRCFAFRSAITAPAMLSFAAMMPWMLLFVFTSIWLKIVDALFASQSGTNFVGPFFSFLLLKSGLRTASLPLLNQNAFWSVWPPQSSATVELLLYVWLAFMPAMTHFACAAPT